MLLLLLLACTLADCRQQLQPGQMLLLQPSYIAVNPHAPAPARAAGL
jgi:hypothetical protein